MSDAFFIDDVASHDDRAGWAEVDLGAIANNVAVLREAVAPSAVWVVVKANAYGHGLVPVAAAAVAAGAEGLCVALVSEGEQLRRAGITSRILVLQEAPTDMSRVAAAGLETAVYTNAGVDAAAASGVESVHLKIDTGMNRVGVSPADALALAQRIAASPLRLASLWTHLAKADEPDDDFTLEQMERFDVALASLVAGGIDASVVHIGNSAGALAWPDSRRSFVRAGIAVYGLLPSEKMETWCTQLRPAMSLKARVAFVKRVNGGEGVSYGLRHRFDVATNVATVPLGYADGVARRLSSTGGAVLINGLRRPIVGVVTMDQFMVDCGDDDVAVGDEVVLIGTQGGGEIRAEEWADRLNTINYEIVCGIGARVPRRYRS
jgi:alanine racemase